MKRFLPVIFLFVTLSVALHADEGMWLFENPPKEQVKEKYGFDLTDEFLEHLRLSSCRFGRGGSASFVSPQGLIATNHHVGSRQLHEHSTPENNLLEKGFYAKTFEEELKCPGLEVIVLTKIEDATEETKKHSAGKERDAFIAQLEQKKSEETGLRCEVMKLFQGGVYHLYCYKVYNDIRLVWAPEAAIAAFGGDPDNYEYPRYCLDVSMFRAYENDKPATVEHFLKWTQPGGTKDGDLVFVSGHPGTTNRAYTQEHLEFMRDTYFPWRLQKLYRQEVVYSAFANRSLENLQRIADALGSVQNYRKRAIGQLQGLQTSALWEGKLSARDSNNSYLESIENTLRRANGYYHVYDLYEGASAFNSQTFRFARTLVRLAAETQKPNEERLKEYQESNLAALKASLFADTPIYEDVEIVQLTDSLTHLHEVQWQINQNASVRSLIQSMYPGISPKELAVKLVKGSKLRDAAERKRIAEGGIRAIRESYDPMINLAVQIDNTARYYRKRYEEQVENPLTNAYTWLAEEQFKKLGDSVYPDATFTLRLSFGAVKGYQEDDGTDVAPVTNTAGMYARAAALKNKEPFDPPKSWKESEGKLNPQTAFNFVSTNDIIGGNSGSPIINAKGEIIGLVFDGNIQSLSNNFVYSEEQSRCVSVHADVILESLQKIYQAERLVKELGF